MAKAFLTGQTSLTPRRYYCALPACLEHVSRKSGAAMFCPLHWQQIPGDLRSLIEKKYRPKRIEDVKWSKPFAQFIGMAIRELKHISVTGHQIPKPADFMWDDPPAPLAASAGKDVSE